MPTAPPRKPAVTWRHRERRRQAEAWHALYGRAWQRARLAFLGEHPLCAECERAGRLTPATVVDHIRAHKGDLELFWDAAGNWQSLCATCHSAKTAREEKFGR